MRQLVFVMSAWAEATLGMIRQPFILIEDPASGHSLCGYHLEDQPQLVRNEGKSVVMCRIFLGPTGIWQVEAVGHMLDAGFAGHPEAYRPIYEWIAEQGWSQAVG